MRLAFTSDIHIDLNGTSVLDALCGRVRELAPDVLLVAGDIATPLDTYLETLVALRACTSHLLVVAGNHDAWTTPEALAAGIDSRTRIDTVLAETCRQAGAQLLDVGPAVIDGIGFAGNVGWYDLSTREGTLDAPMEAYRSGRWQGMKWSDVDHAVFLGADGARMPVEEVARACRDRLRTHLRGLKTRRIVVATHMLAFEGQIHRKDHPGWRFANAYMGSLAMGDLLRSDPRIELAIAGHTHHGSDLRFGRLRAIASPLGYRREWKGDTPEEAVVHAVRCVEL